MCLIGRFESRFERHQIQKSFNSIHVFSTDSMCGSQKAHHMVKFWCLAKTEAMIEQSDEIDDYRRCPNRLFSYAVWIFDKGVAPVECARAWFSQTGCEWTKFRARGRRADKLPRDCSLMSSQQQSSSILSMIIISAASQSGHIRIKPFQMTSLRYVMPWKMPRQDSMMVDQLHDDVDAQSNHLLFCICDSSFNELHCMHFASWFASSISFYSREVLHYDANHILLSSFTSFLLGHSSAGRVDPNWTPRLYQFHSRRSVCYAPWCGSCTATSQHEAKMTLLPIFRINADVVISRLFSRMPCQGAQRCHLYAFLFVSRLSEVYEKSEQWYPSNIQSLHPEIFLQN